MRLATRSALVLVLAASAALAHQGVKNAAVLERMEGMTDQADAMKTLGDMATGKAPFDAAKAAAAREALIAAAAETTALFAAEEFDPRSEARPEIWTEFEAFSTAADRTLAAARALDTADAAALAEGLRAIGATCSACHEDYRLEQ